MKILKSNPILKIFNNSLNTLPTPSTISLWWNIGSLLGLCLIIQIITGFLLSTFYCPRIHYAFERIIYLTHNVHYGWLYRLIHANGASLFFICIYLHIGRNLYYESFNFIHTWITGVIIFFLTIITAFIGYVLPWGQISYWGATVITNLISAIPYIGNDLTQWIWRGFTINNITLNRFFSLHFIIPLIILMLIIIHLTYLHQTGSRNPIRINLNLDKIPFHPYFTFKDLYGAIFIIIIFLNFNLIYPFKLIDPDNFISANPLITPPHIQPEWYFLFAYAILRSIPRKLGGVLALIISIIILFIIPFLPIKKIKGLQNYFLNKIWFWLFIRNIIILTWIGAITIEYPFIQIGTLSSIIYFSYYLITPLIYIFWDKISA